MRRVYCFKVKVFYAEHNQVQNIAFDTPTEGMARRKLEKSFSDRRLKYEILSIQIFDLYR